MSAEANTELVRRAYAAFSAGDVDALSAMMSPDVVHVVPGSSPISGVHKGLPNALALYGQLAARTDGTMRVEVERVTSDGGDRVISVHRSTGRRPDGRSLGSDEALLFTISDGRITEIQDFFSDIPASDAFWA
jgi:ketosteroid isomerase-like protein